LRNLANKLGVRDSVEFAGQISRQQLKDSLHGYSALVFPSLHDSGGSAVLEALQEGIPVICLDLGGPGVMIDSSCGIVVSTTNADEARTVKGIENAMVALATMPAAEAEQLSRGAIARAKELSWVRLTESIGMFQR
jgi:glycosyltransferase involved in cell wall biosynthesis